MAPSCRPDAHSDTDIVDKMYPTSNYSQIRSLRIVRLEAVVLSVPSSSEASSVSAQIPALELFR